MAVGDPETILCWIEAGFPPWGCDNCRGAEYGPDGVPCPACNGRSDLMEPPERAKRIYELICDFACAVAGDAVDSGQTEQERNMRVILRVPWYRAEKL